MRQDARLWASPSGSATRLALALSLTLAGAGPLLGQEIPLRAGEHSGFTRLVLRVPEGSAWALLPAPGGFELRGPREATFDTGEVFGRVPRDRIAALRPRDGGRLGLEVACDCHGKVFRAPGVGLVLDVIDGPAPVGATAPGPATPPRPSRPPIALGSALPLLADPPAAPLLPGRLEAAFAIPPEAEARVARAEAAIVASVSEAARHGFLNLAPGAGAGADPPEEDSEADGVAARLPGQGELDPAEARPGVTVRSGVAEEGTPLGATGAPCLPNEHFDMASWVGSGDFGTEIPARLAALTDARDRLDPGAAEALARAYLAFGFGREAMVALDLDGAASGRRDVLRVLARLIDGEPVPPDAFGDQAACLGPVALWRALARGSLRDADERERTAMTLALRALPEGARGAVALRLAGLFLDAGDAMAAEEMAALAGRGSETILARAEIAREIEGPAHALAELEAAAQGDARMTPEAMAELLDLLVEEGRPVGEDTLELARALRFEHGGSRVLLLSEARALTADGRFEEALALLDGARAAEPGDDLVDAITTTVAALTESLDDAPFLEFALSGLPEALPTPALDAVARRLSDLGFPDEAWALRSSSARAAAAVQGLSEGVPAARSESAAGTVVSTLTASAILASASETPALDSGGGPGALIENEPTPVIRTPLSVAVPPPALAPAAAPESTSLTPAPLPAAAGSAEPHQPRFAADPSGADSPPTPPVAAPIMSLAERRALLTQAGETAARAAALLEQDLSP